MGPAYTEHATALDPSVVAALWSVVIQKPEAPAPYRVLPDGCLDLVLRACPGEPCSIADPEIMIVGPAHAAALVDIAPGMLFLGLRFQPGRGGTAFGLATSDLTDLALAGAEAEDVLGLQAGALRGARTSAALRERLMALALALAARVRDHAGPTPAQAAVDLIRRSRGRIAVGPLARHLGVSERTLHRIVTEAAGLSPKRLASVLRFQHAHALVQGGLPLAEAAVLSGYSDQAHMSRAFRSLGGLSPGEVCRAPPGATIA